MAASDKPFNNQRRLDIVFAVSSIVMLFSVGWMLAQDYSREYKTEQRIFAEIEVALAQRLALTSLPDQTEFDKALKEVEKWREHRKNNASALADAETELIRLRPAKERAEAAFQAVKADVESITSFRNIALEHASKDDVKAVTERYDAQLKALNDKLAVVQQTRDDITNQMKAERLKIDAIEGKLTKAAAEFKKVNDKFDAQVKVALNKRWTIWHSFRMLPVIDGFAAPLKIHQFTINDIPIDYNFKQVTRFDRCMSCHVGIDRPAFTRANLESLTKEAAGEETLKKAADLYKSRVDATDDKDKHLIPNPADIRLKTISDKVLTASRITEFCVHPRLDLFVGSNSKHPAEKFGCTSCHSGQGSGTSFTDASHSPNNMAKRGEWTHDKGWEFNHQWDFPMHSKRFVEASCLKCHHEVTDLVGRDGRIEAPKVFRGFNLIKENGCFGCHEISGWKSGQRIGPDLRLESNPPLEDLTFLEQERAKNDPDNRPGNLRKVGPSLARVHEKVSKEWIEKWLSSPSSFRADTKMPHYYNLSTNSKEFLLKYAPDQANLPDAEMASIAHFLTTTSKNYLAEAAKYHNDDAAARKKDDDRLLQLVNKGRLEESETVKEQTEFAKIRERIRLRKELPLADLTPDYEAKVDESKLADLRKLAKPTAVDKKQVERVEGRIKRHQGQKKYVPEPEMGRVLFSERGCLACHVHQGVEKSQDSPFKELVAPAVHGSAVFGPNLTQVAEKFADKAAGRKWLMQWIINPQFHSPRSRMPVTHLTAEEAADLAEWLLNQPAGRAEDDPWHKVKVETPKREHLEDLARVYLIRMLSKKDTDRFLKGDLKGTDWDVIEKDLTKDEVSLRDKVKNDDDLKFYLGKKAVTRLGCFGCHDIPGFENVKSIGVGLNDWGKKPADRLAFEDIDNFFKEHYYATYKDADGKDKLVDSPKNPDGKLFGVKDGKQPYEAFFAEALIGHHRQREGYLNQKIRDPRSYDYNRLRSWDDRARMPQFQFARPRKKADEGAEDFKARTIWDEAEARESVATFVLGLTAEQVPTKSINQPTGDRLAEVKGRQVLDKYNCAGCHLIRPGVYDFKLGPKSLDLLDGYKDKDGEWVAGKHEVVMNAIKSAGVMTFPNHANWTGRNATAGDRMTVFGMPPTLDVDRARVSLRLTEAFRFTGRNKEIKSIPAATELALAQEDWSTEFGPIKEQADLDRAFMASAPYGGTFANLLAPWLNKKDPDNYKPAADYAEARASLPPSLIGQGERTQRKWLTKFLKDPHPVRRITILRMPKFNMSDTEVEILVEYFAAVTRLNNPGIGLPPGSEVYAAASDLNSDFWRKKTVDYVARLKVSPDLDKDGKLVAKGRSAYQGRIEAYTPAWKALENQREPELQKTLQQAIERLKVESAKRDDQDAKVKAEPDAGKKKPLTEKLDALNMAVNAAAAEKEKAEKDLAANKVDAQKLRWETEEAYAADSYRLLTGREGLCAKCHQIGSIPAGAIGTQGPPLDMVFDRLRPDWIERWVNEPTRFLHYDGLMPSYFNKNKQLFQPEFSGTAEDQVRAVRDALINYPRVQSMPINRVQLPLAPPEK